MLRNTTKKVSLYIGCLPKRADALHIENYLQQVHPLIRVELALKRNLKYCRGHGTIICPDHHIAKILLTESFFLYGRRLVIEELLSDQELVNKYNDLTSRKLKIVIRYPSKIKWTNQFFIKHFRSFGEMDIVHLKEDPFIYLGKMSLVGNVTFKREESANLVCNSSASYRLDYKIERKFKSFTLPEF